MSAMSQIMDATYCIGADMDFGRMFDQYLHKGSETFDLALSIPDPTTPHNYMTDQGGYGSYEGGGGGGGGPGGDTYGDLSGMAPSLSHQEPDTTSTHPPQPTHHPAHTPHNPHQQPMYPHQMGVGGMQVVPNPQFPPQNMYIPPISQHALMTAHGGYPGHLGHGAPVYTNGGLALPPPTHPHHPHMMGGAGMLSSYYPRPPMSRSGGSPTSGGSPSPGSDDSDDSTPLGQLNRAKRPSPDNPEPGKKKPKVSKKSKKKKDPNEPQKPVSAYALFFRDTQAAIKGSNPNASFGEVSKIVASMWDALEADNKSKYKKKTEAAKKEYLKALAAYRASLVSKGEGDGYGAGYTQFGAVPGYGGYPPVSGAPGIVHPPTLTPTHLPGHSPPQLSPLAKKSPLLTSLMAGEPPQSSQPPQPMMTPPMSQPMPPSGPPMITHNSMPGMTPPNMGPQSQQGSQVPGPHLSPHHQGPPPHGPHQPGTPHMMTSVPPSSPYMAQGANPSLGSPSGLATPDGGSPGAHHLHKAQQQLIQTSNNNNNQQQQQQQQQQQSSPQHQQQGQQQQQQQSQQQQQQQQQQHQGSGQQGSGVQQGPPGMGHPGSAGGNGSTNGGNVVGGTGTATGPTGHCIRAGCNNPAVLNPEWEDEYCSNECVVTHCRDVFSSWVASNQDGTSGPTYPAAVK